MAHVYYPDFADTVPTQPGGLPAEVIEYRKRPYIARGLDMQGRQSTPARIPRARTASPVGILTLGIFAASAVLVCYMLAALGAWLLN